MYDRPKPDGQPRRCLDTMKAKKEFGLRLNLNLMRDLKNNRLVY